MPGEASGALDDTENDCFANPAMAAGGRKDKATRLSFSRRNGRLDDSEGICLRIQRSRLIRQMRSVKLAVRPPRSGGLRLRRRVPAARRELFRRHAGELLEDAVEVGQVAEAGLRGG